MSWEQLLTGQVLRLEVVVWDGRKTGESTTTQNGRQEEKKQDGFNNNCTQEQIWDCVPVLARQDTPPLSLSSPRSFSLLLLSWKKPERWIWGKRWRT